MLNFSKYENENSKFHAELGLNGGYITFSNSGKGGDKKYFTLSLDSFLNCLKDIKENHTHFVGHESYNEKDDLLFHRNAYSRKIISLSPGYHATRI